MQTKMKSESVKGMVKLSLMALAFMAGGAVEQHYLGHSSAVLAAGTPEPAAQKTEVTSAQRPGEPNIFASLSRRVVPSVVNISTVSAVKSPLMGLFPGGGFPGPFEEFFGDPRGSSWRRQAQQLPKAVALGTGFIVDKSGIILTNNHVIDGADKISIQFTESPDEKPTEGRVIGRDPELDVALIQVKTERNLVPIELGDSDSVAVGDYVMAVGNPFGQGHSVTHGIISAKGRLNPGHPLMNYLQTDAPINPGNSGGPLIDLQGRVVGINNAIEARAQGIGFAIPINSVKSILPQLRSHGKVQRGYLGIGIEQLRPEIAEKIDAPKDLQAPMIAQVNPGGPAWHAGLQAYDVVINFNGKPVHSQNELISEVTPLPEGATVPIRVLRSGKEIGLKIRIGARPVES